MTPMPPAETRYSFLKGTRFLHSEPQDSFEEWLISLISSPNGDEKSTYYMRRLTTSTGFRQGSIDQECLDKLSRISDHELAMYTSDRLRAAGMHERALDILIESLDRSSNKQVILERIGYVANQISRSIICGDQDSCLYSNDKLDQWASRILSEYNCDKNCSLALGISAHFLALHDPHASQHLLNEMLHSTLTDIPQTQACPSSMLLLPGPGKAGTTSMFDYISNRFELAAYKGKEIDYWDIYIKHGLSPEWYLNHFYFNGDPRTVQRSSIECSPSSFGCIHSISNVLAHIKQLMSLYCILTLRDPVSRSISMFAHEYSTSAMCGDVISNIKLAINQSVAGENTCDTIFYQSRYEIFAAKWIDLLGSSRCLTLFIEEASQATIDNMMNFWGYKTSSPATFSIMNASKTSSRLYNELQEDRRIMACIEAYFEPTYEWIKKEKARVAEVML